MGASLHHLHKHTATTGSCSSLFLIYFVSIHCIEYLETLRDQMLVFIFFKKVSHVQMWSSCHLLLQRPKYLRPFGKIYQAINADTLRAQNMETWPYFNQVIFHQNLFQCTFTFKSGICNSFLCYGAKNSNLGTKGFTAFLWHVAEPEIFFMCNGQGAKQFWQVGIGLLVLTLDKGTC